MSESLPQTKSHSTQCESLKLAPAFALSVMNWTAGFFFFAGLIVIGLRQLPENWIPWIRQYSFQVFLLIALMALLRKGWRPSLSLNRRGWAVLGGMTGAYFVAFAVVDRVIGASMSLSPIDIQPAVIDGRAVLLTGVIAPVLEELFFRDLLFRALCFRFQKVLWAAALSSLVFMLAHMTLYPGALLLGLISCGLYVASRSIVPSIVFHALSNLSWYFLPLWFPNLHRWLIDTGLVQQFFK